MNGTLDDLTVETLVAERPDLLEAIKNMVVDPEALQHLKDLSYQAGRNTALTQGYERGAIDGYRVGYTRGVSHHVLEKPESVAREFARANLRKGAEA